MEKTEKEHIAGLVHDCLKGKKEAWDELIKRLIPVGIAICGQMRLSSEETLDVVWECNYRLLKNLEKLKEPEKLFSYYRSMIENEIKALIRGRKRARMAESTINIALYPDMPKNPDEILSRKMQNETVLTALGNLPERCFKLLYLLFLEFPEPSYKEISEIMKIPISSIGPTRRRCLKKLQEILSEEGFNF
ncbi:MAG: sigma-70 family RNA polymerase sigma factor [candidate division Zixibacteria bacterium]|nr:sigma-70 family RNA polymerase sigma factor [candidate division Zixibacteria bacterium]NIR68140.1 sigma-70 family RNA polymerase sigma factor [candidate division Zixibacteria bacterium]NIS17816.1 sigma-70 family RNA polymerase sigma factor [candidate division Zixibacteria bacterium]NIS49355.1 sigma-70 family RNA polymerase sigma factor [candidate division Zixibacteria bacterium]NIT54134.1 sigma-70 family RNA polymerase sigma factor [candidate division Zixibacteria bacterium]